MLAVARFIMNNILVRLIVSWSVVCCIHR